MAKTKRKPLTKKIRFEVFKRDSFTCQYCGESAPEVVLEVDHIVPVKDGGLNDILNLVTACFDCNRGKGCRELSDETVVSKAKNQAKLLQERREQLFLMAEWQSEMREQADLEYAIFVDAFYEPINDHNDELGAPCWQPSESGTRTIKRVIRKFGIKECLEAIGISHDYYLAKEDSGAYTSKSVSIAFDKVGGICFNRRKEREA